MAAPNQSTGLIPSNLTPTQILHLIATNPELLNETERQMTQEQKISIIHNKIMRLFQQQKAKQAQNGQAGGGQASGSSPAPAANQGPAKRGPGRPPAQQQQQIPNRNGQQAQPQAQMQQPQQQPQGQGQGQQVQGNQPVCDRHSYYLN